jgi:hypothetical protein
LVVQPLPSHGDVVFGEYLALARIPCMHATACRRGCLSRVSVMEGNPVGGRQELHAVRRLEPINQGSDPVESGLGLCVGSQDRLGGVFRPRQKA